MNLKKPLIIGLAGTFASGKDTLAKHLEAKHGFMHVSTGDLLREETKRLYGSTDRAILQKYSNELRRTRGAGVLIGIALEHYQKQHDLFPGGLIASGIRSTGEAEAIHAAGGTVVFVDAPIELRYERAFKRQRDADVKSFEDFKKSEEYELSKPAENKTDHNIGGIRQMADVELENAENLADFLRTGERVLKLS